MSRFGPNSDTLLDVTLNHPGAVARCELTKNQRCSVWHVPANTTARYLRVIHNGVNFMHFAQVEVWGTPGVSRPVGKCGAVECGRNVTSVVVHASREPQDIDVAYRRAVKADAHNADLLRQYETYSLEYDKYGRGEGLADTAAIPCLICKGGQLCEVCTMEARYQEELDKMPMLSRAGSARASLAEKIKFLMNAPKPPLNYAPKEPPKKRSLRDRFRRKTTRPRRKENGAPAKAPDNPKSNESADGESDSEPEMAEARLFVWEDDEDDGSTLPPIGVKNS